VLGVVIDATQCRVVSASLDGALHEGGLRQFSTPGSYDGLIAELAQHATELMNANGAQTFGLGISLPGLIDDRQQRGILSPNLPMTNGQSPASDLSDRLGVECVMLQEADALCLAERHYGIAGDDLEDFAMLDVSTGVGLGVCSGGRLLKGHRGLAGEIGHITVRADGRQCGCGNVGCLETEASDSAFAWAVSNRLGEKLHIGEVLARVQSGEISVAKELEQTSDYLAIGMAAVINLFNPSTLFIYGRLFEADETLFDRLIEKTENRSLTPSFADCRIVQAQGSKRHGAVAGIVQHLTNSLVPGAV
jgi:N-acetylglucosamine repressor